MTSDFIVYCISHTHFFDSKFISFAPKHHLLFNRLNNVSFVISTLKLLILGIHYHLATPTFCQTLKMSLYSIIPFRSLSLADRHDSLPATIAQITSTHRCKFCLISIRFNKFIEILRFESALITFECK